eukprot:Pgem_evm1s4760
MCFEDSLDFELLSPCEFVTVSYEDEKNLNYYRIAFRISPNYINDDLYLNYLNAWIYQQLDSSDLKQECGYRINFVFADVDGVIGIECHVVVEDDNDNDDRKTLQQKVQSRQQFI